MPVLLACLGDSWRVGVLLTTPSDIAYRPGLDPFLSKLPIGIVFDSKWLSGRLG